MFDLCTDEGLQGAGVVEVEDGHLEFVAVHDGLSLMPNLLGELDDVINDVLHCLSLWRFIEEDLIVIGCVLKGDDKIIRIGVFIYPDLLLLFGVISIE